MADYQDLYIERFHPGNPQLYEQRGNGVTECSTSAK